MDNFTRFTPMFVIETYDKTIDRYIWAIHKSFLIKELNHKLLNTLKTRICTHVHGRRDEIVCCRVLKTHECLRVKSLNRRCFG